MDGEDESTKQKAVARKEALRTLRAAQELSESKEDGEDDAAKGDVLAMKFRNYVPQDGEVYGTMGFRGGDDYSLFTKIWVGGFLVGILVIVNLVGLLVQSVFYYVCKSFHHQAIDKSALHDHLGGYLGDYVSLKSSIQMENFDI